MISIFDIEKLKKLLQCFYIITHIRITIFDSDLHEIIAYPSHIPEFCYLARKNNYIDNACKECDKQACEKVKTTAKTYIYNCHMGLIEAISPIKIRNIVIGYLMFGHLRQSIEKVKGWHLVKSNFDNYLLTTKQLRNLQYAYNNNTRYFSEEYLIAAVQILETVASYVHVNHMADLEYDALPVQIDSYITEHLTENLSCQSICEHFQISRSKLYKLVTNNYGVGIATYIRKCRIEKAKILLKKSTFSIKDIAYFTGFTDYNYFTKIFKKMTEKTPRDYKKTKF
ncbi:PocR ligand-binding domain-containing protein [Pectinatus haikarae]|uniref:PocR ligand-binding domain-containing protein n=1 Tax=Pectinatus haikarae TaxID=349096 RepID=UPI0018C76822|nr:PocR ligand-binding domain-containing protein [Pectinatus haikarae]